jgi:hypothetical protein
LGEIFSRLQAAGIRWRSRTRPADGERRITGLQRRQINEIGRLLAKVPVGFPREQREVSVIALGISTLIATTNFIANSPKLLRFCNGQRSQHHLVHKSKDRGCRTDSQC